MKRGVRMRCQICGRAILKNHKFIRVVVELVSKTKEDGLNPNTWSAIDDWKNLTTMHLQCARETLASGGAIPYGQEVDQLAIDEYSDLPEDYPLKVIQGGGRG